MRVIFRIVFQGALSQLMEASGLNRRDQLPPLRDGLYCDSQRISDRCRGSVMGEHVLLEHAQNLSLLSFVVKHAGLNLAYAMGMETAGDRLRKLRKMRDMTLEELGGIIGITPQAISQIETGSTKGG